MVKDEDKKLEALARKIHLSCEDDKSYGREDWRDIVIDAGLGIDRRTADAYYRLARIRRLIHEESRRQWRKGEEFNGFLPKLAGDKMSSDTVEKGSDPTGGKDAH